MELTTEFKKTLKSLDKVLTSDRPEIQDALIDLLIMAEIAEEPSALPGPLISLVDTVEGLEVAMYTINAEQSQMRIDRRLSGLIPQPD